MDKEIPTKFLELLRIQEDTVFQNLDVDLHQPAYKSNFASICKLENKVMRL